MFQKFPYILLLSTMLATMQVQATPVVEPEAAKWLQTMSNYLGSLKYFTVHSENTEDEMLNPGQKIQLSSSVNLAVKRPNKAYAAVTGDSYNGEFFYDGKTMTLYSQKLNTYTQPPAEDSLDKTLDKMQSEFNWTMPLADLVMSDAYKGLLYEGMSGQYLGLHQVNGTACHHLLFSNDEVDWQIWIDAGEKPLPRKYLITSKWDAGSPQFTAVLSEWNTAVNVPDRRFSFNVPQGSQKLDKQPAK